SPPPLSPSSSNSTSPPLPARSPLRPPTRSISSSAMSTMSRHSLATEPSASSRSQGSVKPDTPPPLAPEDTAIVANADPPIPGSFPMRNPTSFHTLEGLLESIANLNMDETLRAKPFAPSRRSESPLSISHTEADEERFSSSSASSLGQPQSSQPMTKRQHALQELLSSERAYASDLALICEVHIPLALGTCAIPTPQTSSQDSSASSPRSQSTASDISHIPCGPPMSMEDTKIIFNNVQELALFSESLCDKLEKAIGAGDDDDHVGGLFLSIINEFEAPYKYYITRHPTALAHLQNLPQTPALTNYLSRTQSVASAVSHAWDISSLLIKPVQRLLKYPLLMLALYEETPDGHPDKENLDLARKKMEEVARNVNEGRRRAEVVKEVLSSKKPLSAVNLSKMKNIRVGFNRLPADADSIEALKVERMHMELKRVDSFAQQFARNVLDWSRSMSNVVVALRVWAISFGKVIGLSMDQGSEAFDAFLSVVEEQLMPLCVSLEATVNDKLLKEIAHLLNSMTQPFKLLASMMEQEPLHHHLLTMNMNNRRPPPNLIEASNNYRALRDQLAAELPDYLLLLHKGLTILTRRLVAIQTEFWRAVRDRWGSLWNMLRVDGEMNAGYEETIKVWWTRWTEVDDIVSSINITQRRKLYTEIVVRSRNSTHSSGDSVQSRRTSPTTGNVSNVLSALEPTHASLTRTRARGASDASVRAPRPRTAGRKISNESLRSGIPRQTKAVRRKTDEFTDYTPQPHTPPQSAISSTTPLPRRTSMPLPIGRPTPGRSDSSSRTAATSFAGTDPDQTLCPENGSPEHYHRHKHDNYHQYQDDRHAYDHDRNRDRGRTSRKSTASDESWLTVNNNDPRVLTQSQRDSWINKETKYVCRVIHSCVPPASVSYFSFPFFTLVEDDMYEVLQEAGHPSMHPKLPLYVDDGEDCLLLCRDVHQNVGWAFASFLEPL
ncbi:hypothetical protein M378DRAFT_60270, partial [Amanita muscaria Koide BX008]